MLRRKCCTADEIVDHHIVVQYYSYEAGCLLRFANNIYPALSCPKQIRCGGKRELDKKRKSELEQNLRGTRIQIEWD